MLDPLKIQLSAPQRMREGIEAICPIDSFTSEFSLGKLAVKFTPSAIATKEQTTDAQAYIDSFDWQDERETQSWLDAKEPALKTIKDGSIYMVAEIDAFLLTAASADLIALRAEAVSNALRQKTLILAVQRLAGMV